MRRRDVGRAGSGRRRRPAGRAGSRGLGPPLASAVAIVLLAAGGAAQEPDLSAKSLAEKVAYCAECHREIHDEWKRSRHAQAWTDPVFQAALAAERGRDPEAAAKCIPCHAPLSLLDSGWGKLPRPRAEDLEVGVECFACHVGARGTSGPHGTKYHRSREDERYRDPVQCTPCHGQPEADPVHDQRTAYEACGETAHTCQSCHMRAVERVLSQDEERTRRQVGRLAPRLSGTHDFPGAHDPEFLEGAAELDVRMDGDAVVVRIQAKTGHFLPGGGDGRLVRLVVTAEADEKEAVLLGEEAFDFWERPLRPDREEEFRFPLPSGKGRARATLTHRLLAKPHYGAPVAADGRIPGDATVTIAEVSVPFPP